MVAGLSAAPRATASPTEAAPTARNDRLVTLEDTTITYTAPGALSNDTDPEGRRLTARMVRRPRHGTARLSSDGRLVYTPDPHWSGRDRVVYVAQDPAGRRDRATVVLVVRSVNDAPRLSMRGPDVGREYSPAEFTMSARDVEGDYFTYLYDCGDGSFTVTETPAFTCVLGGQGKDAVVRGRAVDARGASSTVTMRVPVRNQSRW